MMTYVGIDPGKSGAIAALFPDGTVSHSTFDIVAYSNILNTCRISGPVFAVIEKVHSMPKQGVASSFSFGENFGLVKGLLYAHNIPFQEVSPNKWKRAFGVTSDKQSSIDAAQALFPSVDMRATQRCKKPHDGIAEAFLMAEYARRIRPCEK